MNEVRDAYLILCKRCGNRHWISIAEMKGSEAQMLKALRCERCKMRDVEMSRITLPYGFPMETTVYDGFPGKGPHYVLARCYANTYGYVIFDWLVANRPNKHYTLTDNGRVLKTTIGDT